MTRFPLIVKRNFFNLLITLSSVALISLSLPFFSANSQPKAEQFKDYQQVNAVIHLQTPVSGGTRTFADYIRLAKENNIQVLIINDHDNLSYEYSIYPLRWLAKKTVTKSSVLTYGAADYLELFTKSSTDVMLVDGVESTPFYYWTGSFQMKTLATAKMPVISAPRELTLHDRGKHMLVIGLNKPDAYEKLPTLANGYSSFDAYHGNIGDKPYQEVIDYVRQNGGLTFWAHPEAEEKWNTGGVAIETKPYTESLLNTVDYTGFAVLSDGYQKVGRINGIWDTVLKEYCDGKRNSPAWAIGELDDYGNKQIDSIQTVLLLKDKSYGAIIDALKSGRMYTVLKPLKSSTLSLENFAVEDTKNESKAALSGGELTCQGKPIIRIKVKSHKAGHITVKLICQGKLIKEYNEPLPFESSFRDDNAPAGKKIYYRLDITDEFGGKIISNPIFVIRKE
ncbi:MAG: hypothetical protein HY811_01830 [Planctomycetes bacterium]|nr:hypothetical protein [Planctomycetota bacterium]